MAIRKQGKYWHLYYRINGRIVSRTLHTKSESEARCADASMQIRLNALRMQKAASDFLGIAAGFPMATPDPAHPRALPATSAELPILEPQGGPSLESLYRYALKHRPTLSRQHEREWARFCRALKTKCRRAADLTPKMCLDYLERVAGKTKSSRYNNLRGQLSVVIRASLVESGLKSNPFDAVIQRRNTDTTHYRPFTEEEQARVLAACSPHWRILSIISRDTGLRLTDCRRLRPCDIQDDIITLTPGKTARFGRAVRVPIMGTLKDELQKIEKKIPPDVPFCDAFRRQDTFPHHPLLSYYGGLLATLGITETTEGKAGFHSWRVTFVTRLRAAGISDQVIRGIVGHASDEMVDLYSHDTSAAVAALKKLSKKPAGKRTK